MLLCDMGSPGTRSLACLKAVPVFTSSALAFTDLESALLTLMVPPIVDSDLQLELSDICWLQTV